jgi:gas vesicle protein
MDRDGLINFFLGLSIGVGVGFLFAPKSGEETRHMLMSKADEGTDYLRKQASDIHESASEAVEKGRNAVNRQKEILTDAIDAGKQAYREAVEPEGGRQV